MEGLLYQACENGLTLGQALQNLDHPAYVYLKDEFKKHAVTSAKLCRGPTEMEHIAQTYLCLLQSTKKHEELREMYKGKGERTTESAAAMVGLALPEQFDPEK